MQNRENGRSRNITTGATATTFDPNGACSRAQAVTFLWRAAGSPAPKSHTTPFTDVEKGSYYEQAVLWAAENGIATGTSATTFEPDAACSRAQIVTFLWRVNGKPASHSANPFADVSAAYYTDAVLWAVESGIKEIRRSVHELSLEKVLTKMPLNDIIKDVIRCHIKN